MSLMQTKKDTFSLEQHPIKMFSVHDMEMLEVYVRIVSIVYIYLPTIFPKICFFPSSYRWITTMTVSPVLKSESS